MICYVDIDSFKPFNDIYGYGRGDEVLLCLAQCLNERIDPSRDFVGHIGGDDFLLVLGPEDWRRRLDQLLSDFQTHCRRFYRPEHLEAGCFTALNRQGVRQEFALLSLSIGVVHLRAEPAKSWMPVSWLSWLRRPSIMPRRFWGECVFGGWFGGAGACGGVGIVRVKHLARPRGEGAL